MRISQITFAIALLLLAGFLLLAFLAGVHAIR